MFGHKKILPLGSQRVPSKQQQLYPAVWVKERGLILLPPPGQKLDLPLHAGVELLPVGVAAFTGCMFQQMLPQRRARGRSVECTWLEPDSKLST